MELFDAIAGRHSYRGEFTATEVSRDDLRRIVSAGISAPSGCNGQTTTFVIVDDPDKIVKVAEIIGKNHIATARALIVCVIEPREVYQGTQFAVEDCAAAVENMLLAVTALGYATVWLDGVLRHEGRERKLAELLEVPEGRFVRVLLPIGVPVEEQQQPEKLPFEERAWFNTYGK